MEIRNTPILVRVIRFQSLLGVVYLWLNWLYRPAGYSFRVYIHALYYYYICNSILH